MRVCFIATEFKGIGAFGGFGVLTHDLALGIASRGVEVLVAMPRQPGQAPIAHVSDVKVLSYRSPLYTGLASVRDYASIYRMVDADVYHSEEPSVGTALAQMGCPDKIHVVTFQDPRTIEDWRMQWRSQAPDVRRDERFWRAYQRDTGSAARRATARYCQAKYIVGKASRVFRLTDQPGFLPNPVRVPVTSARKSPVPQVCFLGRWDSIKRPELFLDLAARFPDVRFVLTGASLADAQRDTSIRETARRYGNVDAPGWVSPQQREDILGQAWILVNTSTKECLPVSYLEAGAHRCAILSHVDSDGFATRFGYWAQAGDLEDYERGLKTLLRANAWRRLGEDAYEYVSTTHEYEHVIDEHIKVYERLVELRRSTSPVAQTRSWRQRLTALCRRATIGRARKLAQSLRRQGE